MLALFIEWLAGWVLQIFYHPRESFSTKEGEVLTDYLGSLSMKARTTRHLTVIAMVGAVGAGKSTVARVLAERIRAVVIEGDEVRRRLRSRRLGYDSARLLGERAMEIVLCNHDANVILDSDHADFWKRASARAKARRAGARFYLVRVVADIDFIIGRIVSDALLDEAGSFFGGASSRWTGERKGAVIKLRELWRRTPHHWRWSRSGGGSWQRRRLSAPILAHFYTSSGERMELQYQRFSYTFAQADT